MSKNFSNRQKFIESCNELVLRLETQDLNENIVNQLFDNVKTVKEIGDFYKKLLTNNNALQYYLRSLQSSIKRNINQINNEYLNKVLSTLNDAPNLKNLIYLSTLACATSFYIDNYAKIPDLVNWFNGILNSQLLGNVTIDSIFQFFEMLIKIVGSIVFVYKILIEPYKNEIMGMVGSLDLSKVLLKRKQPMTESKFTNYNKTNMKKVRITESQLRGMVRQMLNEMDGMSIPVGRGQGFASTVDTPSEVNFEKNLGKNLAIQTILKGVKTPKQLNGIFKDIIEATNLFTDKTQMINAINTAFNEIDMQDGRKDNRIDVRKSKQSPQQSFQDRANMGSNLEESKRRRF